MYRFNHIIKRSTKITLIEKSLILLLIMEKIQIVTPVYNEEKKYIFYVGQVNLKNIKITTLKYHLLFLKMAQRIIQ